jgi:hypothetical protein
MSTCCSKHVEAWNKYIKKECVKLIINQNYVKMHGQQNIKIIVSPLSNLLLILSLFRKWKAYFDRVYLIYEEGTSKEQFNKFVTSEIPTVDTVCHN